MRTKNASGTAALQVANQLIPIAAVEYATLDFIHAASTQLAKASGVKATAQNSTELMNILSGLPSDTQTALPTALFPLLWNLDSTWLSQCLQSSQNWDCLRKQKSGSDRATRPRTDIRERSMAARSEARSWCGGCCY